MNYAKNIKKKSKIFWIIAFKIIHYYNVRIGTPITRGEYISTNRYRYFLSAFQDKKKFKKNT